MANYYATARSNYFKVKDEAAFRAWAKGWSLGVWDSVKNPGTFAIYDDGGDASGWPTGTVGSNDEDIEFEAAKEISQHLADGQVAILMEAGAEKMRYVSGSAIAIHSNGESVGISLNDIYKLAIEAFPDAVLTDCTY